MSEHAGEKTEQPTPRRLEEAWKKGEFARSIEIQTAVVLGGGFLALVFTGREMWRLLANTLSGTLAHLHDVPVTQNAMQGYLMSSFVTVGQCVWPVLAAASVAALLAGGSQSRFRTASEALAIQWERLSLAAGFKRIFSVRSSVSVLMGVLKLGVIIALTWHVVVSVLHDPVFSSTVDLERIGQFMAGSSERIVLRVLFSLGVIAAIDYAYQFYQKQQDLMMTREEVKEEARNSEGNPHVRSQQRRRRQGATKRKMLLEVPQADVVVTNPTHLAVALRYDRTAMRAPRVVAKGSRLNALRIREIARQHHVPILENKPLARLLFKHGRVGSDIPTQLYAAVAEVLAWVYRVNAYRYHRRQSAAS
jgi:flagellar biosynthetic protein FlhB